VDVDGSTSSMMMMMSTMMLVMMLKMMFMMMLKVMLTMMLEVILVMMLGISFMIIPMMNNKHVCNKPKMYKRLCKASYSYTNGDGFDHA
jgi:hypothetical protein